jgi:hypothetical protein
MSSEHAAPLVKKASQNTLLLSISMKKCPNVLCLKCRGFANPDVAFLRITFKYLLRAVNISYTGISIVYMQENFCAKSQNISIHAPSVSPKNVLLRSAFYLSLNRKYLSDCVYPCPCGYYGDSLKPCTCAPMVVTKYQKRISGPLLDRIDTAKPHRSAARGLSKVEQ